MASDNLWPDDQEWLLYLARRVEIVSGAIRSTDPAYRPRVITYVNPHYCAATGYTEAELLGRTPAMLKSGLMPPAVYREL